MMTAGEKGKVLIVDDNQQNRIIAKMALEDRFSVHLAKSGEACLAVLPEINPDVILLDWMMPGLDGLETLARIREELRFRNIRIVMLTAKAQAEDKKRAWEAKTDGYIIKPFEIAELVAVVENKVEEKRWLDKMEIERKDIESQLRQAQKMEALGVLAGGIAHDFNNILSPIKGFSQLLELEMSGTGVPDRDEAAEHVREILTAVDRAEALVRQILSFSQQRPLEKSPVQVDRIVKEALKLIRSSLPATIGIETRVQVECGIVLADPTSIHQVVMNLCTNAYHAMQDSGGTLEVLLDEVADRVIQGAESENGFLRLKVRDTGCGMPPEVRERIFDPFYTTKESGKGTGLGLSVVHGIVTDLGGMVTVKSETGKGTVFEVFLPQADECLCVDGETQVTEIPLGKEKVLIIDDNTQIGLLLAKMLEMLGYRPVVKTDPKLGVHAFWDAENSMDGFDLVLTDMQMPGMSGLAVAENINGKKPVVLMTGYADIVDEAEASRKKVVRILSKPVERIDLAVIIRSILDGKTSH